MIGFYLSYPNQVHIDKPQSTLNLEKVTFPNKSGAVLHGWYIQGIQNKAGVLLLHGVRSNRLQMLNRAIVLNKQGYSILLFDFQAHGESIGEKITFGYLEALDAEAGFSYLKQRINGNKIGVIGVSLGGAAALLGDVKKEADAMVLESVYPTIEKAIENRLKIKLGDIGAYLMPLMKWQLKLQLGIDPNDLMPIEHMSESKGALLIIGGEKDQRTTLAETKMLYAQAKKPKALWIVKNAGHINIDRFMPKEYKERVLSFFKKYL